MIFSARAKKIGNKNIFIAVLSIFSSLPLLIVFHVFGILLFILPMSYLLSTHKYKLRNFIGFDRYKLPQLSLIDKLNCLYCSYANGLATYYQLKIKEIFLFDGNINILEKTILYGLYPFFYLSTKTYRIHSAFTYNKIVFPIIAYQPPSIKEIVKDELSNKRPIRANNSFIRKTLKKERIFSVVLSNGLSAIESFWCPLKNHHKHDVTYPKHHQHFYDLENKNDVIKLLKDLCVKR